MRLIFPSDAVVVVAGVPGAGKTTLIRRAVDRLVAVVVDTDDQRAAGRRRLLNVAHYARSAVAVAGRRPVVIHSRGTHAAARRAIALLAGLRGRPAHLVMIDVSRADAEAGQRARGRRVGAAEMQRQVARWQRLMAGDPETEGWVSVTVLDRRRAARIQVIEFGPRAGGATIRGRADVPGATAGAGALGSSRKRVGAARLGGRCAVPAPHDPARER